MHRHGEKATADLVGVARAGHVADAETVGIVICVVTAPALFHAAENTHTRMEGGAGKQEFHGGGGGMIWM